MPFFFQGAIYFAQIGINTGVVEFKYKPTGQSILRKFQENLFIIYCSIDTCKEICILLRAGHTHGIPKHTQLFW